MPITSHPLPWLAALCSMGAVAVWAAPAGAYCRTTTCDPSFDSCQVVNGCVQGGKPLRWPASCVSFGVQRDGSERRNIDYATALDVINAAFQRWTSADCGGGSRPSILLEPNGEPIICAEPRYNIDAPNANVWMFRDLAWPYETPGSGEVSTRTLALTTVTFNVQTGDIYDADVEINSRSVPLDVTGDGQGLSLAAIVTHEAGHFLGLSHSTSDDATMRPAYGEGMEELSADDEAGICAVYPADAPARSCNFAPRHGFSSRCYEKDDGCSTVAPGRDRRSPGGLALAIVGLGLGLFGARKKLGAQRTS